MSAVPQAAASRARAILLPRMQGSRPAEMARRGLSHPGSSRGRAAGTGRGGQRGRRRLGPALASCGPWPMVRAQVAQLVEHVTENHGVGGSIPPLGTIATHRQSGGLPSMAIDLTTPALLLDRSK